MSENQTGSVVREECKSLIAEIKGSFRDYYDYDEAMGYGSESPIYRNVEVVTSAALSVAKEITQNIYTRMSESNTIILTKNKPGTPAAYGPTDVLISDTTGYRHLIKLISDAIIYACISKYFEDSDSSRIGSGIGVLTVTPNENPDEHRSYDLGNPEDVYSLINS